MRTFLKRLVTLGGAILVALAVPIAILVIGAPIMLVVGLMLAIVRAL